MLNTIVNINDFHFQEKQASETMNQVQSDGLGVEFQLAAASGQPDPAANLNEQKVMLETRFDHLIASIDSLDDTIYTLPQPKTQVSTQLHFNQAPTEIPQNVKKLQN